LAEVVAEVVAAPAAVEEAAALGAAVRRVDGTVIEPVAEIMEELAGRAPVA
jgi:hypothetical protein